MPGYRQLSRQREREKEREREGGERGGRREGGGERGGERGSGTVYHSFYCLTCRANLQIAAGGPWVSTSGCRVHEGVPA